jgi:hypothetical protein
VWVAAALHSPKPPRICSHPGWWAQQNAADDQDFAIASTPLICVRPVSRRKSTRVPHLLSLAARLLSPAGCREMAAKCFRRFAVAAPTSLTLRTSLDLLSPRLTRSRYCPAPVRVLGMHLYPMSNSCGVSSPVFLSSNNLKGTSVVSRKHTWNYISSFEPLIKRARTYRNGHLTSFYPFQSHSYCHPSPDKRSKREIIAERLLQAESPLIPKFNLEPLILLLG